LDSLFKKVKSIWKRYFDIDNETLILCSADTIFTYFQDKLGMTRYLLFVGDNSTGKSNALRIFHQLGYRPLFDVSITPANIYNFLGQFEEGQGIILEDEIHNIENQEDKMRIYKTGYVSGAQVTRLYESSNNTSKGKGQQKFNTFCFKAFSSEQQPNYKAKGFAERIFTIKCSPGTPQYDISEVTNDAGDTSYQKLYREIEDLRKLLLVYRILHYDDQIPDIQLSIKNRDKQLCKPLLRLFGNTKVQKEIINALSKFITEKRNIKLNSLDFYLFSIISDLVRDEHTPILNETFWELVCSLPGATNPKNPQSYQTEDFGMVSKARITKICQDKFGAIKGHDGHKRSLVFNKNVIEKLKVNYSQINEIKILDNISSTNTSNTFNTFWKGIEENGRIRDKFNINFVNENEQKMKEIESNSEYNNKNSQNDITNSVERKHGDANKVLKVLEDQKQTSEERKENEIEHNNQSDDNLSSNTSYLFVCYYCDKFIPTNIKQDYLKHIVLSHNNKPAYPSKADLNKNNLKLQGKRWEI
jgi:hypothetical protein